MHRHKARVLAVTSAAALMAIGVAGPAAAHGGQDGHGGGKPAPPPFSIQAAVDAALPGATVHIPPGKYYESVTIRKDGISLRGYDVVIKPPATPVPTPCDGEDEARVSGICIIGDITFPEAPEGSPPPPPVIGEAVRGVSVRGVTVQGFSGDGLIGLNTEDLTVRDNKFKKNLGYGAASFITHKTTFKNNASVGNAEAGFYVGDSPDSRADVRGNYSAGNELGFFFRNASNGKAQGNVAEGNCIGMLLLADAGDPGPVVGWKVRDNKVVANNKECPPNTAEDIPPLSGAGIVLSGAQGIQVRDNTVRDHNSGFPSGFPQGGIVVVSGFAGTAPSAVVEDNRLRGNQPADLFWDGTETAPGAVDFDDNRCRTSIPEGLCD